MIGKRAWVRVCHGREVGERWVVRKELRERNLVSL